MTYAYTIVKTGEAVNCDDCCYWSQQVTSKPCCYCAGARLDSTRNYYMRKGRGKKCS